MAIDFHTERYVNLETFRRDGRGVRTPVWVAVDASGRTIVYTNVTSGKVKRIQNRPEVRVAPCDMRGSVTGEWVDGTARIVAEPAEKDLAIAALVDKYGWQMRLALLGSRVSGRASQRAVVELRV